MNKTFTNLFKQLRDPTFLYRQSRHQTELKSTLMWTGWLLCLTKSIKDPKLQQLISVKSPSNYMIEIIKQNKHTEYVYKLLENDETKLFSIHDSFPFVNPEIFLSKQFTKKLDMILILFLLEVLYTFKLKHLKNGSFSIYLQNFKVLFQNLSKLSNFPIPCVKNGFPSRFEIGNLIMDKNWLEPNLDRSLFEHDLYNLVKKCELQNTTGIIQGQGMKSISIKETTYFLKLFLYVYHRIPWDEKEIYENPHNFTFFYYMNLIYFFLTSGPLINGSRNLYKTGLEHLHSNLQLFIEKGTWEDVNEIEQIIKNGEINPTYYLLEFVKKLFFDDDDSSKCIDDFCVNSDRKNLENGTTGILRTTTTNSTTHKKIGKSKDKSTTTQTNFLVCGHQYGDHTKPLKSTVITDNQNMFPCPLCSCLKHGMFIFYGIQKNLQYPTIQEFHKELYDNDCFTNENRDTLSYALTVNKYGELIPEKIIINTKNNKCSLPLFDETKNKIVFTMKDPGRWIMELLTSQFFIMNDEKIYFEDFLISQFSEIPQFTLTWFPTKDFFYWYQHIKKKLKKKEKWSVGCYSLRGESTFLANKLNIPKYICQSWFGWCSKEGTQEKYYNHDDDLRNDSLIQIYFQISVYFFLCFGEELDFFTSFKDLKNSPKMEKFFNELHPLVKPN